eukprot:5500009-Prymnesium_polylepis.1
MWFCKLRRLERPVPGAKRARTVQTSWTIEPGCFLDGEMTRLPKFPATREGDGTLHEMLRRSPLGVFVERCTGLISFGSMVRPP